RATCGVPGVAGGPVHRVDDSGEGPVCLAQVRGGGTLAHGGAQQGVDEPDRVAFDAYESAFFGGFQCVDSGRLRCVEQLAEEGFRFQCCEQEQSARGFGQFPVGVQELGTQTSRKQEFLGQRFITVQLLLGQGLHMAQCGGRVAVRGGHEGGTYLRGKCQGCGDGEDVVDGPGLQGCQDVLGDPRNESFLFGAFPGARRSITRGFASPPACSEHHGDGGPGNPPGDEGECVQGRPVELVGIVHAQQQGALLRLQGQEFEQSCVEDEPVLDGSLGEGFAYLCAPGFGE